jgi:LacI family transcriptional regulator
MAAMAETLASLARQVGVDPSLVSRVLRGDPNARISDEKRARILELAKTTGYRANRLAKSLRTQRTNILGMLTPDITNPFHSWLFRAVEERAKTYGYDVILCNTDDDPERSKQVIQTLSEGHVDGLLVATARTEDPSIEFLREIGMPYVLLNRRRAVADDAWFGPDARHVGWMAADHLAELGHRRIAFIQGDSSIGQLADRFVGFRAALSERGIEFDQDLLATELPSRAEATRAIARMLHLPSDKRPTAFFVAITTLVDGVVNAIYAEGLRIPDDVSVLGYSGGSSPSVTSVCVPTAEMGRRATEQLIQFLNENLSGLVPGGPVCVEIELVDQGTTAPPKS